ncbi:type II secretion system F family protein [Moritella sp. F3]|uniref:type II secretion system F family protein n=1 Tax=Moritella sp. F3 TaxID=2718882 RepID=UPI0018E1006B|nr:type II secretion system F family protein [Moritella sp. F3]GIC78875.1 biotin synthase [Moritella sp. F1]GIC81890.1 biotin synthase [Moritella sp. F3]
MYIWTPEWTVLLRFLLIGIGIVLLLWVLLKNVKRQSYFDRFAVDAQEKIESKGVFEHFFELLSNAFSSNQDEIKTKFIAAGFYQFKYASLFMSVKYFILFGGGMGLYFLSDSMEFESVNLIAIIACWLVLIIILPDAFLNLRAKQLTEKISNKLPYLLDLMAVCVQTGMTIESAMSYLSKEMTGFDKDLTNVLVKTNDRARIVGLAMALDELYLRVPSNEMRSFVMTLKQSLQFGSSISQVLTTLSGDIRQVQMLGLEEKIGKLAAKMSIPLIVFIMVPVVILIAAPGIMRMMVNV